jgi:hypothetical protein
MTIALLSSEASPQCSNTGDCQIVVYLNKGGCQIVVRTSCQAPPVPHPRTSSFTAHPTPNNNDIALTAPTATPSTRHKRFARASYLALLVEEYGAPKKTRKSRKPILQCWCSRTVGKQSLPGKRAQADGHRKTGITLADRGVYDEHGLEPISGIFSSPEKSPPKRGGTMTASESMDIQESMHSIAPNIARVSLAVHGLR